MPQINYTGVMKQAAQDIRVMALRFHHGSTPHPGKFDDCGEPICAQYRNTIARLNLCGDSKEHASALESVLETDSATIADKLLVCDVDVHPNEISLWTGTQRVMAVNWAEATYLLASDNVLNEYCRAHDEDAEYDPPFRCICRPPKPEFLNKYPSPSRVPGALGKAV